MAATPFFLTHPELTQNVQVASRQLFVETGWPYSPGANEAALQIGGAFGVTGTRASGTLALPAPLTFPLNGGDVPIKSVPASYAWLSDVLDKASTFWETTAGEGFDANELQGCNRGTRWGKYVGISIQGTVPGLDPPTVDGGHPVPMLINLMEDPVSRGPGLSIPGLPLFVFLYPGTQDVWGIYMVTKDDHNELTADVYVPSYGHIRDKTGTLNPGDRKVAHGLFLRARKMGTIDSNGHTQDFEVQAYLHGVQQIKSGDWCEGLTLAGLGWFLESTGEFLVAAIIEIAKDVAAAIGGMACDILKDPEAAQALLLGLAVITGGPGKGQSPQALAAACQGTTLPQCPPGMLLNPMTKVCEQPKSQIPWIPILIVGGVLTWLLLSGDDKKPSAPPASP